MWITRVRCKPTLSLSLNNIVFAALCHLWSPYQRMIDKIEMQLSQRMLIIIQFITLLSRFWSMDFIGTFCGNRVPGDQGLIVSWMHSWRWRCSWFWPDTQLTQKDFIAGGRSCWVLCQVSSNLHMLIQHSNIIIKILAVKDASQHLLLCCAMSCVSQNLQERWNCEGGTMSLIKMDAISILK